MKVDRSLLFALLACAFAASSAHAYSSPDAYAELPAKGGGGGRWFSGSPADGYSCSVCHSSLEGQRQFPLYVTGLPLEGYTVQEAREVVISWPEFAQRWREIKPDPMAPIAPGAAVPAMSMIAEFVAESGKASGVIEIRGGTATDAEQCEITRSNLPKRYGTRLYQVRPGQPPYRIKPDANGTARCEARHLGQRCILALSSCGAQQSRFVWTPPMTQEGAIWFSAGFVTSEQLSGTPEGDSVYEISVPMVQKGASSGRYQETLRGTCAVSAARSGERAPVGLLALGGAALAWLVRRRRARVLALALLLGLLPGLGACADHEPEPASSYPSTGLYTPGSTLGASDPTDVPMPMCMPVPGTSTDGSVVGTQGTLEVEYKTKTYGGYYAPKNAGAVWIETMTGAYVATLEVYAALRRPSLVYWQERACLEMFGPDVISGGTLTTHEKMHVLTWNGVDFAGNSVPDGPYKLNFDVTETDLEPGELNTFDITKGPAPYSMALPVPPATTTLSEVTATWMPQ